MSTVREGWNRYAIAWADRYGGAIYRVQIGAFRSREGAEEYASRARSAGFEAIVKKDSINQ